MADENDIEGGKGGGVVRSIGAGLGWCIGLLEPARQFAINMGVLAGVAFGGPAVYKMATKPNFVLRDISVPGTLSSRGFTGDVIAHQILDHIAEIDREAGSKKEKAEISGFESNRVMPAINLPVGGLSLGAVVSELRTLMGTSETKVTGEIFIADTGDNAKGEPPQYGLRLRIAGDGPIYRSDKPSPTIEPLIEAAAQNIMRRYDPINLGYYYYRKKSYRRALALTDEVIASGVTDDLPWAYTMRGLIARDQGQHADAAAELREALNLAPKFWLGHVTLASVLRLDGSLDEAEASARKAVELAPTHHEGYGMLALILMDRGKPQEALAEVQKGVQADNRNASAHIDHGRLLSRIGRHEDALTAFKTAAALKPTAEPLFEAAKVAKELKREADALSHLRRATQVEPKNPQTWLALGEAQLERGQNSRATQSFAKAMTIDADTPNSLLRAVRALDAKKRFVDSDHLFTQASSRITRHPAFLIGLSEHLWLDGRKKEAGAKLHEALAVETINATHLEAAGRLLEDRQEPAEALAVYRRAVLLDPRRERGLRPAFERLTAVGGPATAAPAPAPARPPAPALATPSPEVSEPAAPVAAVVAPVIAPATPPPSPRPPTVEKRIVPPPPTPASRPAPPKAPPPAVQVDPTLPWATSPPQPPRPPRAPPYQPFGSSP